MAISPKRETYPAWNGGGMSKYERSFRLCEGTKPAKGRFYRLKGQKVFHISQKSEQKESPEMQNVANQGFMRLLVDPQGLEP
jgi:hypothetical protein